MRTFYGIAAVCALLVFPLPSARAEGGDAWQVLFTMLPARISTELAGLNIPLYILKQTHEPLLRQDDGQNFRSKILTSWSRNINSTEYAFCPDTSRSFDKDHPFSVAYLHGFIHSRTQAFDPSFTITETSACVKVKFTQKQTKYLSFLSLYDNAPTLKLIDGNEAGLGEFRLTQLTKEEITLIRKHRVSNGYNAVICRLYRGVSDPNLQNREITDFNRIPETDIPEWVPKQSYSFVNMVLKVAVLALNVNDEKLRKLVFNCLDIQKLREAFYPHKKSFVQIQTVFPVGISGAKAGAPLQNCTKEKFRGTTELIFTAWRPYTAEAFKEYFKEFKRRYGVGIKVKVMAPSEFLQTALERPHPYNLTIIGLDATRPNYSAFLDGILPKDGFFDFDMPILAAEYENMRRESDAVIQTKLASALADEISDRSLLLPLYQDQRVFYYPSKIKNVIVGREFLEYPEVADFQW
ncbi:MAG TPA: hypothetical protein DCZ93_12635 [Elusimicrobia bacterium]|nr:hypothetical protein [Elusimicrobiota bacterium]